MKNKLMLAMPMLALAVLSMASVMAACNDTQWTSPAKFSISADGGVLSNIGAYNNFTFTKASADIWSNGKYQSLGDVMLSTRTVDKKYVQLNLHLVPAALVCDDSDSIWKFEYLAHGTYWVQGSLPKQVYLWVDYSMDTSKNTISLTGEGIDGLNFSVSNMPMKSKLK